MISIIIQIIPYERRVVQLNSSRYNMLVSICVWFLRIAMIILAVAIPVISTINSSILCKLLGVVVECPQIYFLYHMIYSEIILGFLLCLFINFKEKAIFVEDNAHYLKRIGILVIAKDFLYIPLDFIFNIRITEWHSCALTGRINNC